MPEGVPRRASAVGLGRGNASQHVRERRRRRPAAGRRRGRAPIDGRGGFREREELGRACRRAGEGAESARGGARGRRRRRGRRAPHRSWSGKTRCPAPLDTQVQSDSAGERPPPRPGKRCERALWGPQSRSWKGFETGQRVRAGGRGGGARHRQLPCVQHRVGRGVPPGAAAAAHQHVDDRRLPAAAADGPHGRGAGVGRVRPAHCDRVRAVLTARPPAAAAGRRRLSGDTQWGGGLALRAGALRARQRRARR